MTSLAMNALLKYDVAVMLEVIMRIPSNIYLHIINVLRNGNLNFDILNFLRFQLFHTANT